MWTVDALALLVNKVREKVESLIIPTKVSDLVNDAGYITSADVPTNVSELVNDAGYITGIDDTGWISLGLAANVTAGGDGSEKSGGLYYRVVNRNHVYVRGSVAFTYSGSVITLSDNAIPSAYRKLVYDWCICNGRYIARAYVNSAGYVTLGYVQLLTDTTNTSSASLSNCVINIDYFLD